MKRANKSEIIEELKLILSDKGLNVADQRKIASGLWRVLTEEINNQSSKKNEEDVDDEIVEE